MVISGENSLVSSLVDGEPLLACDVVAEELPSSFCIREKRHLLLTAALRYLNWCPLLPFEDEEVGAAGEEGGVEYNKLEQLESDAEIESSMVLLLEFEELEVKDS